MAESEPAREKIPRIDDGEPRVLDSPAVDIGPTNVEEVELIDVERVTDDDEGDEKTSVGDGQIVSTEGSKGETAGELDQNRKD